MKKIILCCVLLTSFQASSIELVINGVVHQIDSYQIQNNGKRIVIGQKLKPKRAPASKTRSNFNSLIKELDGRFNKLSKEFGGSDFKPYKQDFR